MRGAKWVALKLPVYLKLKRLKRRLRARSFSEAVERLLERLGEQ